MKQHINTAQPAVSGVHTTYDRETEIKPNTEGSLGHARLTVRVQLLVS